MRKKISIKMGNYYSLGKKCKKCGRKITNKNKSGYCNSHRDRSGINNPFYGKSHTTETICKIKKSASMKSKKLWQNKEYADKVIRGVSKPRSEDFKRKQSARIKKWYNDNPIQKEIRRIKMKAAWNTGTMTRNNNSINKSKKENELFFSIKEFFNDANNSFTIKDNINKKWYFPDIFLKDFNLIIEFNGDFWHANPKYYNENDLIYNGVTAKEIWDRDFCRKIALEKLGYNIMVVWEDDYNKYPSETLETLKQMDWESCAI